VINQMKYKFLLAITFGLLILACMKDTVKTKQQESLNIIPAPLSVERGAGYYILNKSTRVLFSDQNHDLERIADQIAEIVSQTSSPAPEIANIANDNQHNNSILLRLTESVADFGEEGYHLSINPDRILIEAETPEGVFYGMQSLIQLMSPAVTTDKKKTEWSIPSVEIKDKPKFPWRGNMLDASRHFIKPEFIKKNLDYLARYKMNIFHWHLTDDQGWRVEVDGYPNLTETGAWRVDRNNEPWWGRAAQQQGEKATYGGFYTKKQIREIVDYAKERFITIVPEIDMPGHSQAIIASYPEVSCDGGSYFVATGGVADSNTVCPGKEVSFEFIEGVLGEVLELFPGDYFHIGGDECNKSMWQNCADCQKRIADENLKDEHELQSYFIQRVEKIVNNFGKKLIGWDEILEGGLAPNAAVMSWRGEQGGIRAAEMDHHVVMTPSKYCYLDLKQGDPELEPELGYSECKLSTSYSYNPIPGVLSADKTKYILGVQGNLWGESIQNQTHAHYMLFPRLQAIAEVGWTPAARRSWLDFVKRLEHDMLWMDSKGIGYAKSMYNVALDIQPLKGGLELALSTEHGNVPIYYTTDGSLPSVQSNRYAGPIKITHSLEINTAAFRNGKMLGKVKTRELSIHKGLGKNAVLTNPADKKYPGIPEKSLTDLLRGTLEINHPQWMGFEASDFEVVIDLEQETDISEVILCCLEHQGKWIFQPNSVEVLTSVDGNTYDKVSRIAVQNKVNRNEPRLAEMKMSFQKTKIHYLKIRAQTLKECPPWHKSAGGKAWFFVDEIIID